MKEVDTGGAAFPHSRLGSDHDGMTLRDYFAAKAMQSYMGISGFFIDDTIARRAYQMADAMLAERKPK